MNPVKTGAIILAGAPASAEMDPDGKLTSRAMVEINGKTMLQYVVDALLQAETVSGVVAIGHVKADGLDKVLEPVGNIVDNINRAIPELFVNGRPTTQVQGNAEVENVLVVCADIPLLTSQAVDDFVIRATDLNADLVYPIVEKASCQGEYASMKRTYVKTGDGCFTGGNMTLVKRDFYSNHADTIARAYRARKNPLALAGMIGYGVFIRLILGQLFPGTLRINMLEDAVRRRLGARLKALVTNYAEIGEDVDKVGDIEAVRSILNNRVIAAGN